MRKSLLLLLLGSVFVTQLMAAEQDISSDDLRPGHPSRYVVQKGDTLWDISSSFLNSPWLWPEIWHVNPQIDNPHLIFPGDVISLVYIDGKPQIVIEERGPASRTVKLTPTARIEPLEAAIPSISLDIINPFLVSGRVVEAGVLEGAPYVVSGEEGRLVLGAGERLYTRSKNWPEDMPSAWGVYRKGQVFIDPNTGEVLGIEAKDIALGRVDAHEGEIVTLALKTSHSEVRINDKLLTTEERRVNSTFYPSAPENELNNALLIAVLGGVNNVGQFDVVAINKGEREELKIGNILTIFKAGKITKDRQTNELIKLPSEKAGMLMVFRTFEKMSYGVVLKATRTMQVGDELRKPTRF